MARMEKEGGETKEKVEGGSKDKDKDKGEPKEKESADDPQFVKDLLSLHDKFINVVNREFCGNALFQKALKDAFVEVSSRGSGIERGRLCLRFTIDLKVILSYLILSYLTLFYLILPHFILSYLILPL